MKTSNSSRTVIITGAGNGIGLAMARSLFAMGDCVFALDLCLENIDATYPNLLPRHCDVTDPGSVRSVVSEVVQICGGVDVLINNACLAIFKPFAERTIEDIRREFEVNYFGYLNMIRAVLPVMQQQERGVIHNVSSAVGYTGIPNMTGYTSTKGAIESLTRTKSSSGLGVPPEMMADPEVVGRKLAKQVGKTSPVLTPDFSSAFQLWLSYHFRVPMGKLLSMMTERAKKN